MAFISKAAHYKFRADIKKFLSRPVVLPGEADNLHYQVMQLESLFEKYKNKISQLQDMIGEYEKIQRSIKVVLRKQRAHIKKPDTKLSK